MKRRSDLPTIIGSATGGLAGCISVPGETTTTDASDAPVVGADGWPSNICDRGPRPGVIPAIVGPEFAADYSEIASSRKDSTPVIGIERDDTARAYPIRATNEIVNDTIGEPILVTIVRCVRVD